MKKDYMTRLERAARWRLPPREAEDVIADYREIVGDPPRPEEELLRDLGRPRDAIRPLAQKKPYWTWLAVFLVMSACILAPGISPTAIGYPIWRTIFSPWNTNPPAPPIIAVLGAVTALMWFHWQGRKEARLPRAIPILLAVLLIWCGGVLLFCWTCARDFDGFLKMWGTIKPFIGPNESAPASLYLLVEAMAYGSTAISLAGEVGLAKGRTCDRRWAAVYILALAAMLTSLLVVHSSQRMDLTFTLEELFRQLLLKNAVITLIGLMGAGVALC